MNQQDQKTQIEILREEINMLKKQLDRAIMEKGLSAEENKDLRENSSYIFWEEQEFFYSAKIARCIREINRISLENKVKKNKPFLKLKDKLSKEKTEKIEIKPHKWL